MSYIDGFVIPVPLEKKRPISKWREWRRRSISNVLLYAIPRTAVLGAILLTGYLGGAVSAHVRIMNPWPSHILFPVYFGIMIWLRLYLRIPALRSFIPLRNA